MSAIMSWKRDKEDAHNNLLHPVECIQSVTTEFFASVCCTRKHILQTILPELYADDKLDSFDVDGVTWVDRLTVLG